MLRNRVNGAWSRWTYAVRALARVALGAEIARSDAAALDTRRQLEHMAAANVSLKTRGVARFAKHCK